jgi:hypothetical protein
MMYVLYIIGILEVIIMVLIYRSVVKTLNRNKGKYII